MHLRGGLCGSRRALSEGAVIRMREDRIGAVYDGVAPHPTLRGYGLGWWIDRANEGVVASPAERRQPWSVTRPILDKVFDEADLDALRQTPWASGLLESGSLVRSTLERLDRGSAHRPGRSVPFRAVARFHIAREGGRMRASSAVLTLAVVGTVMVGCDNPTEVDRGQPQPGVLQLLEYDGTPTLGQGDALQWSVPPGDDVLVPPQLLVAPDTVDAGQPFQVSVSTVGINGCWLAAGQDVNMGDGVAELTPVDVHSGAAVCTELLLLYLPHVSTLTIATPGEWIVRVSGRRVREGDTTWEEPVTAEKTIVVR